MTLNKKEINIIKNGILDTGLTHEQFAEEIGILNLELTMMLVPMPTRMIRLIKVCKRLELDPDNIEGKNG